MFNLNGKNALITGASGGIGRAIAETLHTSGATLTISGTRMEPLEELARNLGDRVHIMGCDLSNGVEVENLSKGAQEKMGSVDILVNNAGITRDNLFLRMTDEDWASVLEVNLTSTMKLCRGVLRGMMKSRWGRIVNIGSVVGSTGNPGQGNYAAAIPLLSGQHSQYTYQQLKNFQASVRSNDYNKMMRNIVHRMTDEEMKAVASYIEGLY